MHAGKTIGGSVLMIIAGALVYRGFFAAPDPHPLEAQRLADLQIGAAQVSSASFEPATPDAVRAAIASARTTGDGFISDGTSESLRPSLTDAITSFLTTVLSPDATSATHDAWLQTAGRRMLTLEEFTAEFNGYTPARVASAVFETELPPDTPPETAIGQFWESAHAKRRWAHIARIGGGPGAISIAFGMHYENNGIEGFELAYEYPDAFVQQPDYVQMAFWSTPTPRWSTMFETRVPLLGAKVLLAAEGADGSRYLLEFWLVFDNRKDRWQIRSLRAIPASPDMLEAGFPVA